MLIYYTGRGKIAFNDMIYKRDRKVIALQIFFLQMRFSSLNQAFHHFYWQFNRGNWGRTADTAKTALPLHFFVNNCPTKAFV